MLTPPIPPFPEDPRTDDPPGTDPDRVPRKEPEPDFGEPEGDPPRLPISSAALVAIYSIENQPHSAIY